MSVSSEAVEMVYGTVPRKTGIGYGLVKSKPEYEAMAEAARMHGVPLAEVRRACGEPV